MSSKQLYCLQLTNSFDDRDNYSSVIIAWQEISLTMAVVRGNMSWLDSGSIGFEVHSRPAARLLLTLHPTKKITLETVHLWWSAGAGLDILTIESGDENYYIMYFFLMSSIKKSKVLFGVTPIRSHDISNKPCQCWRLCQEKWPKNIIY